MKSLSRFVPIVLVIAVFLGWKFYNKGKVSEEVSKQGRIFVERFPDFSENKEWYESAFGRLHGEAFGHAYSMGGRRTSSSFDESKYQAVLIALLQRDAQKASKTEIVESLDAHRKSLKLPLVEFK